MVHTWKIRIPQLSGDEVRRAYLYLPGSYKRDQTRHYPVLYMFDGHNVFFDKDATYGKSWGMKTYMDRTRADLIIAAVECNHSPDFGRLKEYSPYAFKDRQFGSIPGLGHITMEWLIHTFKPYIDGNYRTIPDREHTYIAGSSMGGLMSIYALLAHNDTFSRAAALSPSLWVAPAKLEELAKTCQPGPDTILYMDYGSREIQGRKQMEKHFRRFTSLLMERQIFLTARIVPQGEHCEACWEKQLPLMMGTLLYQP